MPFDQISTPGGGAAVAPAPESAIWSGAHGGSSTYCSPDYRQVTDTDPGTTYVDLSGSEAADEGLKTDAQWASFRAEFPTAVPGYIHGILYISFGSSYAKIDDMYNASTTSTKCYRDRQDWAYNSNFYSRKMLLYPKVNTGGMWYLAFAKPLEFYLGIRVSFDNGSCYMYFLYTLRGAL